MSDFWHPQFADPVSEMLSKVGPKGYIHGWRFVGIPGSSAHANAVRELASRVSSQSQDAARALDRAADSMNRSDWPGARDHIVNARYNLLADHGDPAAVADIDNAARGLTSVTGRQPSPPLGLPNHPAYGHQAGHSNPSYTPQGHGQSGREAFQALASAPSEAQWGETVHHTPSGEAYTLTADGRRINSWGQVI